jgi:hypothetical protein
MTATWEQNMTVGKGSSLRLRNNVAEAPRRVPKRAGFTESAGPNEGFEATAGFRLQSGKRFS